MEPASHGRGHASSHIHAFGQRRRREREKSPQRTTAVAFTRRLFYFEPSLRLTAPRRSRHSAGVRRRGAKRGPSKLRELPWQEIHRSVTAASMPWQARPRDVSRSVFQTKAISPQRKARGRFRVISVFLGLSQCIRQGSRLRGAILQPCQIACPELCRESCDEGHQRGAHGTIKVSRA